MIDESFEEELGIGAGDFGAPFIRVLQMRNQITIFAEKCADRIIASFDQDIIAQIESAEKLNDFKEKMVDCFKARHGAYILGAEQVQEADEELFNLLESVCYNKFSLSALSKNISHYYEEGIKQSSKTNSLLADRAEEAGAATKTQR